MPEDPNAALIDAMGDAWFSGYPDESVGFAMSRVLAVVREHEGQARAEGYRDGIEAAAAWSEETACGGYLDGPSGERVAAGIRALADKPKETPHG